MSADWHGMSAVAQGDAVARGDVDPRDLCAHYLARIAAHDGAARSTCGRRATAPRPRPKRRRGGWPRAAA